MDQPAHFANEAIRKLRFASELNISAYIFGATGYGKTSTVAHVFDQSSAQWISADEEDEVLLQRLQRCDASRYVVIDDLHCLENEFIQQEIVRMIFSQGFRMVLIGRCSTPAWLYQLLAHAKLLVVTEDDLRVTADELASMSKAAGLTLSPERINALLEISAGNAMVLDIFVRQRSLSSQDDDALINSIGKDFKAYLDEQVISHWSRTVQDFLMQMCVVDSFTVEMAEYMTGDDSSSLLLSQAKNVGNIFVSSDEVWQIRPVLLETLRERALKTFGRKRYNQLLYNAGRYYESMGNVQQALTIFEQCGERDGIRTLLIREARKHPGIGSFWDLRAYYQALSDQEIEQEPILIAAVCVLYSVLMNTEKSEHWYARLKEYAAHAKGDDHDDAIAQLAYLDVALPHRGTKDMIRILKDTPTLIRNSKSLLRPVSLTNNQPSVMNGGKDFCEWSKTDVLLANTIGPLVEKILGQTGIGLVQTALGESAYEKGLDHYQVLNHLTKGQNQSENNGALEMTWTDIALQAKLALCTGDVDYAKKLVAGMLRRKECERMPRLLDSIHAFQCWLGLYTNETGSLLTWMDSAPDETVEFCVLNRYLYTIKIYCYIALGKHTPALTLIQRMLAYADYSDRNYIRMDCRLLNAIVMRRDGQEWEEGFMQALQQAANYGFIRIVSEKGAAILPLLKDVKTAYCKRDPQHSDWFDRVMKETAQMARRYPDYLKGSGVDLSDFSDTALQVLRLQAAGYTTKQISEQLHVSQRTVKYHAAETYRKLDAKNLVDAVQIAQNLHIL